MDFATILGLLSSFSLVLMAMSSGGDVMIFVNPPSLLIVVGGSIGAVMSKFGLIEFLGSFKIGLKSIFYKKFSPQGLIEQAIELSNAARKGGLLSLENIKIENEIFRKGIQLLVDGHEPSAVKSMMKKDMNLTLERHGNGQKIFDAIGDVAPAMGMIGTLIGLVQMLAAMDDPKSIGPAMAVALLTTLYGSMIANMFALPISDKLKLRSNEERLERSLIMDAVLAIQSGQNPRVMEEALKSYLPSKRRGES